MNLAIGTFISSLDNILKNKNASDRKDKTILSETTQNVESTVFSTSIQAKYHVLQSKLNKLQNELSREQARLGILEKESIQPSEFSSILFGTTPLFTESIDELVQEKQQLVEKINAHKRFVTEQIRTVEIESENIQSIGFGLPSANYADTLDTIKKSQPPVIHISQRNVERLIKD